MAMKVEVCLEERAEISEASDRAVLRWKCNPG